MSDIPLILLPIQLTEEERAFVADALRNPLAIIAGSMELALQYPDPEEDLHRKRAALKAARRMSQAFKDIFNI